RERSSCGRDHPSGRTIRAHRTLPNGQSSGERAVDNHLRLLHDAVQLLPPPKALGVNLVEILGARWASGEPSGRAAYLHTPDWRVVAGSLVDPAHDLFPGELGAAHRAR